VIDPQALVSQFWDNGYRDWRRDGETKALELLSGKGSIRANDVRIVPSTFDEDTPAWAGFGLRRQS
jgi:hypothetical protein